MEWWIGRRLGWLAVIVFIFAAAFFLKYAFDNNWIGELGRVAIGLVIGAGLCVAGLRQHRKRSRILSEIFTAAGIVVLYLSTWAAFGFYSLVTRQEGGVFLAVLMALAALLSVAYDSPAVALLALAGGLLTPLLLASEHDQYVSLFLYLSVLAAAAVGLAWLRPRWPALRTVALLGVQGLYWAWFTGNYHPEKQAAALVFQIVLFGLFLASGLLAAPAAAHRLGRAGRRRRQSLPVLRRGLRPAGRGLSPVDGDARRPDRPDLHRGGRRRRPVAGGRPVAALRLGGRGTRISGDRRPAPGRVDGSRRRLGLAVLGGRGAGAMVVRAARRVAAGASSLGSSSSRSPCCAC